MDTTQQPTQAETAESIDARNPHDWREARRLQAWKLKQKGWKQTDIAEALGVSDGAVSQWMKKARQQGPTALYSTPPPGREPRLSQDELARLPALLGKGPEHYGFRGAIWTRARVGKVIEQHFGVSYSDQWVGHLLERIDWSRQKPNKRAAERDEQAIERWRHERWEQLKKRPKPKAELSSSSMKRVST